MSKLTKANVTLTDSRKGNAQYPMIAKVDGSIHVGWQEYRDGHDFLYVGAYKDGAVVDPVLLSQGGEVFRPAMSSFDGKIWIAWAECLDKQWTLYCSYFADAGYSEPMILDQGLAVFNQSIGNDGTQLLVLWSRQGGGFSHAVMASVNTEGKQSEEIVSAFNKAYRPTVCKGGDGKLYVAYDRFDGETYDAVVRVKTENGWSEECVVNPDDGMWATQPIVVPYEQGVLVSWYDFGRDSKLSFLSAKVWWDGSVCAEKADRFAQNVSWYQDMDGSYNDAYAVIAYTWGKYNIHVRVKPMGGEWTPPVVMSNQDGHCATHPKVIIDQDNQIHVMWQFSPKNGHYSRNASIMYNTIPVDALAEYYDDVAETVKDTFTTPILTPKVFDEPTQEAKAAWLLKNGYVDTVVGFGDIHGQSGISDGAGQIDQYYNFAKSQAKLDFASLTDHDCYPDWTSKSEWEWMRTACKLANLEQDFASLLSYEWTPNEYKYDYGHKNVYYPTDEGEMFRSNDQGGLTPFTLFESIKQYGGQCIPHHPAAMWGLVSAATDWDFHDDSVQRLVETFSRHAPYECYEDRSDYTKNVLKCEGCCAQDALARGLRIGMIAGSDSHQMEHGIEGGIVGAFMPKVGRQELFDAMYNRFVFGTTGARILPSIKIHGAVMGQEIVVSAGQAATVEISVLCTQAGKVELVKNNVVVKTVETTDLCADFIFADGNRNDSDYYYLRVTQEDGHMAWTSPIWVDMA